MRTTSLYRHFADDGTLLYVGISLSWPARTKQHSRGSQWFAQVARVEIEHFPTREAAIEAEFEAIKRERPQFNIIHNRTKTAKSSSRQKVADAHLSQWVKVGHTLVRPYPKCLRCGGAIGARRKWFNTCTRKHMCCRCYDEWRTIIQPRKGVETDPVLNLIQGPDVIVGPALIYQDDLISVLVAHGESGTNGALNEIVLGKLAAEVPDVWMRVCAGVITIRGPDEITIDEARETRAKIVRKLKQHRRTVEVYDTDISLASAYAARFPSEKSRRILADVAAERGAA